MAFLNLIFSSITKLVFLLLAITACAGFLTGILDGKDFMMLLGMAFSFYFGIKSGGTSDDVCVPSPNK